MASLAYVEHVVVGRNDGAHIAVLLRRVGEREQAVDACDEIGVGLYLRYVVLECRHEFVEESCLE